MLDSNSVNTSYVHFVVSVFDPDPHGNLVNLSNDRSVLLWPIKEVKKRW
jgi:hypothetical protein